MCISSEEIHDHVNLFQLEPCYSMAKTVPGTCFHIALYPKEIIRLYT